MDTSKNVEHDELPDEELFRQICEAVFRDGCIEEWESQLVNRVALYLRIDQETALRIYRAAREKARSLGPDMLPKPSRALYVDLVTRIAEDGEIDNLEKGILEGLRQAFDLSKNDYEEIIAKLKR